MMKLEGALYPWRFRLVLVLLALMAGAAQWVQGFPNLEY